MKARAGTEFEFVGCVELRQILGKKAEDEKQLLDLLEEVPLDSVYYHTHEYFLRHKYILGPYPNDFANWAAIQVRDRVLGERLGVLDPYDFDSLGALRDEIIATIDDHLTKLKMIPRVGYGEPFHFMQSRIVTVPTGLTTRTLEEFRAALAGVDASSIYFHAFEARMRLNRRDGDFAFWIREALGLHELADRIRNTDPYMFSLEQLRSRLLGLLDEALAKGGDGRGRPA